MVLSGAMVHFTCGPVATSATFSTVIFDLTSSIQYCEATLTSLPSICVASSQALISAL